MSSALTWRTINSRKSKIEYQRNVELWSWFYVEPNLLADRASFVELPNPCLSKGLAHAPFFDKKKILRLKSPFTHFLNLISHVNSASYVIFWMF
jgi:hypothetical protein